METSDRVNLLCLLGLTRSNDRRGRPSHPPGSGAPCAVGNLEVSAAGSGVASGGPVFRSAIPSEIPSGNRAQESLWVGVGAAGAAAGLFSGTVALSDGPPGAARSCQLGRVVVRRSSGRMSSADTQKYSRAISG